MFRHKRIPAFILTILTLSMLTFTGCGSDSTGPGYDVRDNLDIAWGHFAGADYSDAIDKFNEVLDNVSENAEAYLGLGWSYAFLGQLADAVVNFGLVSGQPEIVDAYMGLASVYRDLPNYQAAISNADDVIDADSSYQFSRKTSIDYRDAHLIKAQCHYRLGSSNFPEAHIEVNYLCDDLGLDPVPDPSTLEPAEYEQALVDKIAELTDLISD